MDIRPMAMAGCWLAMRLQQGTEYMADAAPRVIGHQAASGSALLVGARLFTRTIDLVTMVVLTRILLPTDFGLVAIAMTMVALTEAVFDLPINQALVRIPVMTAALYDTAFTVGLLRGAILGLTLILGAVPFARAYGDPRLVALICALSLAPVGRGLTSPRLVEYQKNMSFWRDFVIEMLGKLVSFLAGTTTALLTHSYWAIAIGLIIYPMAMAVTSYRLAPYRPRLTLSELPVFYNFLGWMSAAQIVGALNMQSERLLLGKLKTMSQLGLFTTASDLSNIPFLALFGPMARPLLAAFSHLRDDPPRLARSYQNASNAMVAVGMPLLLGISLVAEPAVRLVLGTRWMGAAPLLHWLALSLLPALFTLPTVPLLMTFNKNKIFFQRNSLEFCVKLPLSIGGAIMFGFAGIIASRFVSEIAADLYCIFIVRKLIGLSFRAQVFGSWRSMGASVAMAATVIPCLYLVPPGTTVAQSVIALAAAIPTGAVTYGVASWLLWLAAGRPHGIETMIFANAARLISRRPASSGNATLETVLKD